jgi:hypothetical protein
MDAGCRIKVDQGSPVTMLPCARGTSFEDDGVAAVAAAEADVVEVEAEVDVDVEVNVAEAVEVVGDRLDRRDWAWSSEIVVVDRLAPASVVVEAWLLGLQISAPTISGLVGERR